MTEINNELNEIFENIEYVSPSKLCEKVGYFTSTKGYLYIEPFEPKTYWKGNVCLFSVFRNTYYFNYYAIWRLFEKKYLMNDDEIANILSEKIFGLLNINEVIICVNKGGMHIGDKCQPDDYKNDLTIRSKLGTLLFHSKKFVRG